MMARRCSENIDPKAEDIATKPRRRRHRAKPEPSPQLQVEKPKALARALRRPIGPAVLYEPDGDGYVVTSPHSDPDLWELTLATAFGTRSQSVMRAFLADLRSLCSTAWDEPNGAWKPNEYETNAVLAMVADLQPQNTAQAAMAAQMTAIHLLTMRLAKQALNGGGMVMERDAALTGKLARTYAMQMETYQALRGKRRSTRQTITVRKEVHQSVHYHDHRGTEENDGQSHASPASQPARLPEMPSDHPGGKVVRLPSRTGKGSL